VSGAGHPFKRYQLADEFCSVHKAGLAQVSVTVIKEKDTIGHPIPGVGLLH